VLFFFIPAGKGNGKDSMSKREKNAPVHDQPGDFSLLERFPATPAGHVSFLEFVRDEVHFAAEAKKSQFQNGYPNETIESMVGGIKWAEARRRAAALPQFTMMPKKSISLVLNRELNAGTVVQIDHQLAPVVNQIRDAWESKRVDNQDVEIVDPPELVELKAWLSLDGIKGDWTHRIQTAKIWRLEVDKRHRNIAFLITLLFGEDLDAFSFRVYLFQKHNILPGDDVDLITLEQMLKSDAAELHDSIKQNKKDDLVPKNQKESDETPITPSGAGFEPEEGAETAIKLLPRPKGKRPGPTARPEIQKPFFDWDEAIFHYVDGFKITAGKFWTDKSNRGKVRAIQETAGVKGPDEFGLIIKRTKKRLK
jgi:hypothetical protein